MAHFFSFIKYSDCFKSSKVNEPFLIRFGGLVDYSSGLSCLVLWEFW